VLRERSCAQDWALIPLLLEIIVVPKLRFHNGTVLKPLCQKMLLSVFAVKSKVAVDRIGCPPSDVGRYQKGLGMRSVYFNCLLGVCLVGLAGCESKDPSCDSASTLDALSSYVKEGKLATLSDAAQREFGTEVTNRIKAQFAGQIAELTNVRSQLTDLGGQEASLASKLNELNHSCLQALSVDMENNLMCLSGRLEVQSYSGDMAARLQEIMDFMNADSGMIGSPTQKELATKLFPQYLAIAKEADELKQKQSALHDQEQQMESQVEAAFRDSVSKDWTSNLQSVSLALSDIRVEKVDRDAKSVTCAAKSEIVIPQWGTLRGDISYKAQTTTDGKTFVEVN